MQQIDLALEYNDPQKILDTLNKNNCNDLEVLKLTYERIKSHEDTIYESADHVRDKAKTMLGTASFTAAILFGVAALFVTAIKGFPLYVLITEFILFALQITFFGIALYKSVKVMTQEKIVKPSPDEILCCEVALKEQPIVSAYKNAIAHVLSYANQTHIFIRDRVNMLISAQKLFGYGLICFVLYFSLHYIFIFNYGMPDDTEKKMRDLEQRIINKLEDNTSKEVNALNEISSEIRKLKKK